MTEINTLSRETARKPAGAVSLTPWVASAEPVAVGEVHAALVVLSGVGVPVSEVGLVVEGRSVVVTWPAGLENIISL